jgi:GLPGLI family protein
LSKLIVGFKCKKAFCIKSGTDSLLAWYIDEIPLPFGPTRSRGLPGYILEIYEQKYNGLIHTTAIKIEKEDFTIGVSADIRLLPEVN